MQDAFDPDAAVRLTVEDEIIAVRGHAQARGDFIPLRISLGHVGYSFAAIPDFTDEAD